MNSELLIHSTNIILSVCNMQGAMLGPGDRVLEETEKVTPLIELTCFLMGYTLKQMFLERNRTLGTDKHQEK
jgi:hypothetical protein